MAERDDPVERSLNWKLISACKIPQLYLLFHAYIPQPHVGDCTRETKQHDKEDTKATYAIKQLITPIYIVTCKEYSLRGADGSSSCIIENYFAV